MIGKVVSHYKILEKLGEGGMGVVYMAEDLALTHTVALKFLAHGLETNEPERVRFLHEARAAAILNHPNICTIHDIQEHESQQYIVMEYVDGRTLSELVPVKKLQDAIGYGLQICEALQEAHSKGVVHRDIKTQNIMVNTNGQVKVMDFGLAKLKGSLKLTKTSSTVGTLAYMAPEQLQGGEVDARSDIFSFGVVLYEMLTGHLPFRGEHEAAMMYSILNEEPEPIQKFLPDLSSEFLHVINRSLEKDPEDRYQSVSEMAIDLRRHKKQSARVPYTTPSSPTEESAQRPSTSGKTSKRWALLGLGVSIVICIAVAIFLPKRSVVLNPEMALRILPTPAPEIGYPGLSVDGSWVVIPAPDAKGMWDLYLMNASGGEPRRITVDSSGRIDCAEISPDGSVIAYSARRAQEPADADLFVVSSLGGARRMIAEKAQWPCWHPDGTRIFFTGELAQPSAREVFSVRQDGTDRRLVFRDTLGTWESRWEGVSFSVSPDGKSVAWLRSFSDERTASNFYQELVVHDLETGRERQLTFDKKNIYEVCWNRNNQIIFSSNIAGNINLWMVPSSGGPELQITRSAGTDDRGMKLSADGKRLIYNQMQRASYLWRGSLVNGSTQQLTFDGRSKHTPRISPDGKFLLFTMVHPDPQRREEALYVSDRNGNERRQLTPLDQFSWIQHPWSPDSKWISFGIVNPNHTQDSIGHTKTYVIDAVRGGEPKFIAIGMPWGWINDTTLRLYQGNSDWYQSINSGQRSGSPLGDSTFIERWVLNGKYLLYSDRRKGREGVWIAAAGPNYAFNGKPKKLLPHGMRQLSANTLFYMETPEGGLWRIQLPDGKKEKIPWTFQGLDYFDWSVSDDGKELYWSELRTQGKLVMIENPFK